MSEFVYQIHRFGDITDSDLNLKLNELGRKGWELITCEGGRWIFRRDVSQVASAPVAQSEVAIPARAIQAEKPKALSDRELDCARLVAEGRSNRTIAEMLDIREQSVKNVISAAIKKLNLENRTQLALWFWEQYPA